MIARISLLRLVAVLLVGAVLGSCSEYKPDPLAAPEGDRYVEHGRVLVTGLAACGYCHGEQPTPSSPLAGGRPSHDLYGEVLAPNITPSLSGIGSWSTEEVLRAIRGARSREGELLSPEVHKGYQWMSDADALSVAGYLRTLPAVEREVDRRHVAWWERNTIGFWSRNREVRGFVPEIDPRHQVQRGQYLVDNIARCGSCHNLPATFFGSEGYLQGGGIVRSGDEEKVAPAITASQTDGIGAWSTEQVVHYLQSGETPQGKSVDRRFCPIDFYSNAPEQDLAAVAAYLRTIRSDAASE